MEGTWDGEAKDSGMGCWGDRVRDGAAPHPALVSLPHDGPAMMAAAAGWPVLALCGVSHNFSPPQWTYRGRRRGVLRSCGVGAAGPDVARAAWMQVMPKQLGSFDVESFLREDDKAV